MLPDKDTWLRMWHLTPGTPEAEQAWADKVELHERTQYIGTARTHQVFGDIQPYRSPLDGSIITSRSAHRDHMRQHGVIEMGNEYPKHRETNNAPMDRAGRDIVHSMERR